MATSRLHSERVGRRPGLSSPFTTNNGGSLRAPAPLAAISKVVGGPARGLVIGLLAAVLALQAADLATVGAVGTQLEEALSINHLGLGVLAASASLLGAAATLPFGVLADRVNRVRLLTVAVIVWGFAMVAAGLAGSFLALLFARIFLGVAVAAAGPILASLAGDLFPSRERARIYGYILTGELVGSAFGFLVSGNIAGLLSWRWAFWVLAIPAWALAWALWRALPEPARGGQSRLQPGDTEILPAEEAEAMQRSPAGDGEGHEKGDDGHEELGGEGPKEGAAGNPGEQLAERVAADSRIEPNQEALDLGPPGELSLLGAVRYVLLTRTNVILIVVSATGYLFLGGAQTFGVVFVRDQYGLGQSAATSALAVLGVGALIGVLAGGRIADRLLERGRIDARIVVAAAAFLGAALLLILPFAGGLTLLAAMPLFVAGVAVLSAANPPLDAARLDVIPAPLWGRAEAIRTVFRSLAIALAPLLFGWLADLLGSGGTGLRFTFLLMLIPLAASGLILLRGRRTYPADIATAVEAEHIGDAGAGDRRREGAEVARV